MNTSTLLMTADDLSRLPEDGQHHELLKGKLLTMAPAGFEHGSSGSNIHVKLYTHVTQHRLGKVVMADTGFLIEQDPDTVRAPDVAFVGNDKLAQFGVTKKFFPAAPDLAVEVISPFDTYVEVDEKVEQWLTAGTLIVWVVNPRRKTVTVHAKDQNPVVLKESDVLTGDPLLPGFTLPVLEIFL